MKIVVILVAAYGILNLLMYKRYGNKFMCFSPPVMLATFLIEFALLFYVLWRYKLTPLTRTIAVFIGCLGIFQLAEYMICGGLGLGGNVWARIGYVSITLLPALGIHILALLAGVKAKKLLTAAYGSAFLFAGYFAFGPSAVGLEQCAPNYAVFALGGIDTLLYAAFYYGWLLAAVGLAAHWAKQKPKKAAALRWMAIGYASFILPTTVANIIDPATIAGIPSIMCGFAILIAIIIVWRVLPLATNKSHIRKRS